jgi:hypothetical protein
MHIVQTGIDAWVDLRRVESEALQAAARPG